MAGYGWFELLEEVVHPFSGWYLCEYYFGNEHQHWLGADAFQLLERRRKLKPLPPCGHLHEMAVVFVEATRIDEFAQLCLPVLKRHIILLTGRWHLPAVQKSTGTEQIIRNEYIYRWFLQNPFTIHEKIIQLPYGIMHSNLPSFAHYAAQQDLLSRDRQILTSLPLGNTNSERGKLSSHQLPRLSVDVYYTKLTEVSFVLSPAGDRPDCHRHLEAIGLGVQPICNCPSHFKGLFGDRMIFSNVQDMNAFLENPKLLEPLRKRISLEDQDILSIGYWQKRIAEEQRAYSASKVTDLYPRTDRSTH